MKGLTLIELALGMAIFAIVVTLVTAMFSGSLLSQKQIIASKQAQEEGRYIMEFMQKEARLAQYDVVGDCADQNQIYKTIGATTLKFKDTKQNCIIYQLSGNNLLRNSSAMNSNNIKISNLLFTISGEKLLDYNFDISDINDKSTINIDSRVSARAYK